MYYQEKRRQDMRNKKPVMGWSSWNHYRIAINEEIIRAQADAMVERGLKDAGYSYINIDDGYFGGRDEDGRLFEHETKFPSGMKALADYIHAKGLKAGIYSEAGCNTCGSYADGDLRGKGAGLSGHDEDDLRLFFDDWGYDFLKVDWCGGLRKGLCARRRYTEISRLVRDIAPEAVYNVCRWKFPGAWVVDVADSWRISSDISARFGPAILPGTILNIIEKSAPLAKYVGPGHFNDMDMLQVGRGMSADEDRSHFAMWCMMSSPLLAGNDLCSMSDETAGIITNPDLIAVNQDELGQQAVRVERGFGRQIWHKPLSGGRAAVAVLNSSAKARKIGCRLSRWFGSRVVKECYSGLTRRAGEIDSIPLPPHGIAVYVG